MKRSGRKRRAPTPPTVADLVELRDDLASTKNVVAAAYFAGHGLSAGSERSAICEVANISREKLEAILGRLDELIADAADR